MMMRKSCPRCRGDLFLSRDEGPAAWKCLQCGRSFAPVAKQTEAPAVLPVGAGQSQAA